MKYILKVNSTRYPGTNLRILTKSLKRSLEIVIVSYY